jgi:hypothetical protein
MSIHWWKHEARSRVDHVTESLNPESSYSRSSVSTSFRESYLFHSLNLEACSLHLIEWDRIDTVERWTDSMRSNCDDCLNVELLNVCSFAVTFFIFISIWWFFTFVSIWWFFVFWFFIVVVVVHRLFFASEDRSRDLITSDSWTRRRESMIAFCKDTFLSNLEKISSQSKTLTNWMISYLQCECTSSINKLSSSYNRSWILWEHDNSMMMMKTFVQAEIIVDRSINFLYCDKIFHKAIEVTNEKSCWKIDFRNSVE